MLDTNTQPATEQTTYYQRRMQELGVSEQNNVIRVWQSTKFGEEGNGENILKAVPIFRQSAKGIDIIVYDLERRLQMYKKEKDGERHKDEYTNKPYFITRLETPVDTKDGGLMKYSKPKGVPSFPFFPPKLVDKYDMAKAWKAANAGQQLPADARIDTLYLTEGFFKAFKADLCNIWCVGVQSITTLRDKETNQLWNDIKVLIAVCEVKRIVWLTDGDFMNITSKDLKDGIDLYKRPHMFYNSAHTFYTLTDDMKDVERYFAHINSEGLKDTNGNHPKGLDDLLCAFPDQVHSIFTEFNNFSINAAGKITELQWITRINISAGCRRVLEHMKLHDVNAFYTFHRERRPELASIGKFVFNGTTWKWNEEKSQADVEIPREAGDYMRVGNDYFKKIVLTMKDETTTHTIAGRLKSTILDDHGKHIFSHIPKYEAFTVVPNHTNYQQVINGNYNLYRPFMHEPEEGECPYTLEYIKHIFGSDPVTYEVDGVVNEFPRWELGLDYLTILYKYPSQILPILCLVSEERQTGKSTFGVYLDYLFAENVISIGNEDMKGDFNAHWANKLVIICDETKLDNHEVIQKIKRLSTTDKLVMNAKGKDQVAVPFFAKFILMSNSVDDFIKIDKEEIRFWVHKVPRLEKVNIMLMQHLKDEVGAFCNYLMKRKMVTKNEERHWFRTELLHTEALQRVKDNSVSTLQKRIVQEITELFEACPDEQHQLRLPLEYISALAGQKDKVYTRRELNKMGYKTFMARYTYPRKDMKQKEAGFGDLNKAPEYEVKMVTTHAIGTHYIFERKDFIKDIPGTTAANNQPAAQPQVTDLPF